MNNSVPSDRGRCTRFWARLPFFLLIVVVAVLVAATFVEHHWGTPTAFRRIYGSTAFRLLWGAVAVGGAWLLIKRRMWRRPATLVLHAAFLLILAGALCTALTSIEGTLHLRQGQPTRSFLTTNQTVAHLPFEVRLDTFRTLHYPGTDTPRDYESHLTLAGQPIVVSMNRIAHHEGYRLYQSSYDTDRRGSILTVNYDPYGTPLTYVGYALLILAMTAELLRPTGTFRRLLNHPALLRRAAAIAVVCLSGTTLPISARPEFSTPMADSASGRSIGTPPSDERPTFKAEASSAMPGHSCALGKTTERLPAIPRAKADLLARRLVVYGGRVCPLNTLAVDFCKKLTGSTHFLHLTPEQVLLSWLYYPEAWQRVPMILVKSSGLRTRLGLDGKFARLDQLHDGHHYRLQTLMQQVGSNDAASAQAVRELDEKVALIFMLHKGTLLRPAPEGTLLPEWRITLELLYNRLAPVKWLFMALLTLGIAAFVLMVRHTARHHRIVHRITLALRTLLGIATLILAAVFATRWVIGGFVPLSNGFETMLFLALAVLLVALLLMRRFAFALPFGFLIAGFALLVAHLSDMNPQITPLMPILASPLLSLHVTVVMISYALFALMALNAAYALWLLRGTGHLDTDRGLTELAPEDGRMATAEQITVLNRLLLLPAVFLLTAGIFIGAIWANVSWGRYWGWDPKEVWALITMIIYAFALHGQSLPIFRRPRVFHLFLLLAFLSVLITYFGVNFLLGGKHSYA